MRVRLSRRAYGDLYEILEYLEQRSPAGARNVLQAINDALSVIGGQPEIGQMTNIDAVRVKLVSSYPYKIFYRIGAEHIDIAHIRHAARRPLDEGQ